MEKNKISVTVFSDTHTKHKLITNDLPGGDLILYAGDLMSSGYNEDNIVEFCSWYDSLDNYSEKVFIAGNHDRLFENKPSNCEKLLEYYPNLRYLQDKLFTVGFDKLDVDINIYGSPWQPAFYNWAFNLPRNGLSLESKWAAIPVNTDILITHGPAFGYLDTVEGRRHENLGCELLVQRIKEIKPKIHVCGHIHSGYGYVFDGETHFFNASVLDERYTYTQKPFVFDWYPETNEIFFPE
jgi:hypothetical protein